MVSPSPSVSVHVSSVGDAGGGFVCLSSQSQASDIRVAVSGPSGSGGGCHGLELEGSGVPVSVPSDSHARQGAAKASSGRSSRHSRGSKVAKAGVVRRHRSSGGGSVRSASSARSAHPGSTVLPQFTNAGFDGLAAETSILREEGLSDSVIQTLVSARKRSSSSIYYRVWRSYIDWCEARSLPCRVFSISRILDFLQSGLDSGLQLSTLKGQVSALSIFFQRSFASHSLVKTFFQGVSHLRPPRKPLLPVWDLNLVLSALQAPPFEPLQDIALSTLTQKVVFLVAITSVRRVSELAALSIQAPYFEKHQDKVVFRFKSIVGAYSAKGKDPPFRVTAHSTRVVGASWAFQHQASVEQVCKAATWSSVHTFSKFYKVDVRASADAVFGRKVLQAAVV
ncbi:uncharacterized protein PAF06_005604 [Gastrophryne carolinensis]